MVINYLNNTIKEFDLIDIYRAPYLTLAKNILCKGMQDNYQDRLYSML